MFDYNMFFYFFIQSYLEAFSKFCEGLGGSNSEVMKSILSVSVFKFEYIFNFVLNEHSLFNSMFQPYNFINYLYHVPILILFTINLYY